MKSHRTKVMDIGMNIAMERTQIKLRAKQRALFCTVLRLSGGGGLLNAHTFRMPDDSRVARISK